MNFYIDLSTRVVCLVTFVPKSRSSLRDLRLLLIIVVAIITWSFPISAVLDCLYSLPKHVRWQTCWTMQFCLSLLWSLLLFPVPCIAFNISKVFGLVNGMLNMSLRVKEQNINVPKMCPWMPIMVLLKQTTQLLCQRQHLSS